MNKLEHLLLNKDFQTLSSEEREWVLQHMSEQEYRHIRSTEQRVKKYLNKVSPSLNPAIKNKVLDQFRSSRKTALVPLWQRPIPLWQATAALVVSLLLFSWFIPLKETKRPEVVVEYVRDTIYIPASPKTPLEQNEHFAETTLDDQKKEAVHANHSEEPFDGMLPVTGYEVAKLKVNQSKSSVQASNKDKNWLGLLVEAGQK